jgi:uncharacterized protein involved in exopolysaccharide biosynthesis
MSDEQPQSQGAAGGTPIVQAVLWPLRPTDDDELSLGEIIAWLRQGRLIIVATTLLLGVLAGILAFVLPPTYRAETVLTLADDEARGLDLGGLGSIGDLAGVVGLSMGSGSQRDEFVALLGSRSFTEDFIREQNLLPVLFHKKWDAQNKRWRTDDPSEIPTLFDGYRMFDRKVRTIIESKATGLVTLRIEWTDRDAAASWANLLIDKLNERARRRAIDDASKSLEFLKRELLRTDMVELRQSINRLIESQMSKAMLASVRQDYAFRVLDPALPPDSDAYVKPRRALMIALGLFLGCMLGTGFVLLRGLLSGSRVR